MWVTAGISTLRDGSRRQNVSQCHCAADGTASFKDRPAPASGNQPSCEEHKRLLLWFWIVAIHVFVPVFLDLTHSDRHQIFVLNRIPSGTRDKVLSVFQNVQLSLFLIISSKVTPSSPWWNDMNIRCKIKEFFVLFHYQWDILCCMSQTATSWLFFYSHTHTHQIWQQGPGWKLLHPSCCVAAHVFSGMPDICVILEIWEWGETLLPFVLWGGSDMSKVETHQNPHMSSYSKFWFIVFI